MYCHPIITHCSDLNWLGYRGGSPVMTGKKQIKSYLLVQVINPTGGNPLSFFFFFFLHECCQETEHVCVFLVQISTFRNVVETMKWSNNTACWLPIRIKVGLCQTAASEIKEDHLCILTRFLVCMLLSILSFHEQNKDRLSPLAFWKY